MEKAHSRIKWENYPSIATPLNETNLNKMDIALDEVDNRVLGLDTAKLDKAVANTMVKDIAFDEKTGIFTITLLDGTTKTIDTKLEKVATNFSYDYETQKLVLTLVDGTKQEIDMSTLISQYEFADTSTIGFTVGNEGKITAIVKDGSITEAKLQPNFLANVKTEVSKAKSYADSSYENATTSRNAVTEAKQYRDEALQFRNEAESFAPEGYADLVEQVNENTVKVDTIIAKADLGIKETASGEEIHLTDSAEGKAVEFALYGKAKQNTTSGNQLLDANSIIKNSNDTLDISDNGYTITVSGGVKDNYANSFYSFDVNLIRGKTIYFNVNEITKTNSNVNVNPQMVITKSNNTKTYHRYSGSVVAVNIPEDTIECRLNVYCNNGNSLTEINTVVYKGLRVSFNKDAEWEKYTGGQPSPNPQYPQPIEVSGESGSVEVKSCGKNLFDKDRAVYISGMSANISNKQFVNAGVLARIYYIKAKPNTYYTYSKTLGSFTRLVSCPEIPKFGGTITKFNDNTSDDKATIITGVNDHYLAFYPVLAEEVDNIGYDAILETVMINEGTTALAYEPYKETLATIPTENGLAGIKVSSNGNYTDQNGQQWICDEIVKNADGSGEKVQKVLKAVFDGSDDEGWILRGVSNGTKRPSTLLLSTTIKKPTSNGKTDNALICNQFIQKSANDTYLGNTGISVEQDGAINIYSEQYNDGDLTKWKSHLAEKPMIVYYELATPIHTPLTAEEIAEIEKIHTFYPVTNISNDFDCGMKVMYKCDGKNYIDKKISELAVAMVNNI